jgi:hypothetical protein
LKVNGRIRLEAREQVESMEQDSQELEKAEIECRKRMFIEAKGLGEASAEGGGWVDEHGIQEPTGSLRLHMSPTSICF